jgi:hypothetical protein
MAQLFEAQSRDDYLLFPGCCPMWDNEARKPRRGQGFYGSTPARYGTWLERAARGMLDFPEPDRRLVFINAWNEWAEGTYLEPDRHYGAAYLAETRRVLDSLAGPPGPARAEREAEPFRARQSRISLAINSTGAIMRRLKNVLRA